MHKIRAVSHGSLCKCQSLRCQCLGPELHRDTAKSVHSQSCQNGLISQFISRAPICIKSIHVKPHFIFSKNKQLVVCLIWQIEWDSTESKTSNSIHLCIGIQIWPCETLLKFVDTSYQPDIEIVKLFSWLAATVRFSSLNIDAQCNFRCCELSFMSSVAATKGWRSAVPALSVCSEQSSWASQAPQEGCVQETESQPEQLFWVWGELF